MNISKRVSLLLAAFLAVSSLASCGDTSDQGGETTPSGDTTSAEVKEEYTFSKAYDGQEIRVLNCDDIFSMHARVDTQETTGDALNDAQYNAVRKLESLMGITWTETNVHLQNELPEMTTQLILSGDDEYEIIYQSNSQNYYQFADQGYFYNLLDYTEAQLDKDWWLDNFNSLMTVDGKLYAGLGYSHLCCVDSIGMLYFNQDMAESLNLDLPYDLVRNGTWTIDVLGTYCKAAANLNGDDSFTWKDDGSCVWGMSAASNAGAGWLHYFGEDIITNQNGKAVLTGGSTDRFYNACEKIASTIGAKDGSIYLGHYSGDDNPGSYINCFEAQRALFGCSEVAKANRMRNLDFMFGALPYPKLDEKQERYYEGLSFPASGVAIPVTCKDPVRSATVGDAVNYIYYKEVWPTFSEVTLKAKNLRNDDSIEMLGIILESAAPNLAEVYNIGSGYTDALSAKLRAGDSAVASLLASYKDAIEADLEKVNNQ